MDSVEPRAGDSIRRSREPFHSHQLLEETGLESLTTITAVMRIRVMMMIIIIKIIIKHHYISHSLGCSLLSNKGKNVQGN